MIRLTDILKEVEFSHPKGKWMPLDAKKLGMAASELADMIVKSYAPLGGHPEFSSASDITHSDLTVWLAIDDDADPDLDAVIAGKSSPAGKKWTVMGTKGSSAAKHDLVSKLRTLLTTNGNYIEASGKVADILDGIGIRCVKDPDVIRGVITKADLKIIGDGWYERSIGGSKHRKRLFGRPNV